VINCILIDDDSLALKTFEEFFQKTFYLNPLGKFNELPQSLPVIESGNIDLIFLNLKSSDLTGIDLFKSLSKKPEIIITSASKEYAINAYELNALDYLLKPIFFEKFIIACNRAKDFIENKKNNSRPRRDYFFINAAHKQHKIFYSDILYLEGFKDYTKIHLKNSAGPLLVLYNLKHFETRLDENEFIRVHRSFIVPIRTLNTVSRKSVTIGTKNIPVSDNYRDKFFSIIQKAFV
jgi:two-component system, LytTR family, response regulator